MTSPINQAVRDKPALHVRLTRVTSEHKRLRDAEVEGLMLYRPRTGRSAVLLAEPRDSGNVRVIQTSEVVSIKWESRTRCVFRTRNSEYNLEIIGKVH